MGKQLFNIAKVFLLSGIVIFYGCEQSITTNFGETQDEITLPKLTTTAHLTAANDGLEAVDISGIIASDFVTGGVGTTSKAEETITVEVPAGATVEQAFLYWGRLDDENSPAPSTIIVNGTELTGNVVGGPIDMQDPFLAAITHRVDLTSNGVTIVPGVNSIDVQDNPADPVEPLGASVIVFYSLDGEESELVLFDGVDFLWANANVSDADQKEALQTAVPVTFNFDPADIDRTAELTLFVGDAEADANGVVRPNSLRITVGDGPTLVLGSEAGEEPVFQFFEGPRWDNFIRPITIPAGVDKVTVEPVSGPGSNAESLAWSLAGLSVPVPEEGGGQGCTPGFWRQSHHFDSWTTYNPGDSIEDPFDIPSSVMLARPEQGKAKELTLLEGVTLRGGGVNALIRHAVAALLNASSPDVSYDLSVSEVISKFNAAVDGGDIEGTKDEFEGFNELGCPLD